MPSRISKQRVQGQRERRELSAVRWRGPHAAKAKAASDAFVAIPKKVKSQIGW